MQCPFLRAAILVLFGLGGLCLGEQTDDPFGGGQVDPGPRWMVSVQVDYIEVTHEQVLDLLFTGEPPAADATPLRKKLQDMIRAGQAKLRDTSLISGRSGDSSNAESIDQFIYPTDYEPWEIPSKINVGGKPQVLSLAMRRMLSILVVPATPRSFVTRNLGFTLQVKPEIRENDRGIDLEFFSGMAWRTGDELWGQRKDYSGNLSRITTPDIYSMTMNTRLTCTPGQYNLAGVLSPRNEKGELDSSRKVMVFVRCRTPEVKSQ